jgi:hypothetical protein
MSGRRHLIGDLRAPVLTAEQQALMRDAEEHPVTLTEEAVLAAARERVGLSDFGPEDFRERLRLILAEVDENDNATALVRQTVFGACVKAAANRLQALDLLARHPEIQDVAIRRPLIVAGLPRSGTTHLLGLISADARLRSLPYWEAVQPIPLPGEAPRPGQADPRHRRAEAGWERLQRLNPMMAPYHPMDPDHIHEDLELQIPDFASYYWEWLFHMPRWRDHYLGHDQTPHYAFGRTMLKIMSWQDGREQRWVLKCPQHFEQLGAIMNVYPDAFVIFTHRDPVASLQSIVTQLAYIIRTREIRVDPDVYLAYWVDRVRRLLRAFIDDRERVPEEQRFDVLFDDFVADDMATVEQLYGAAGIELTGDARASIERYRTEHERGRYGSIDHDLHRDFGVEPAELRREFDFYLDRIPVGAEA